MFSFGGPVSTLKDKGVSNLPAAQKNALEFTVELIERLRNGNKVTTPAAREVA